MTRLSGDRSAQTHDDKVFNSTQIGAGVFWVFLERDFTLLRVDHENILSFMASAHFTLHSISYKYLGHQARPIILMTLYMEEGNLPNCQRLMILQRDNLFTRFLPM